MSNPHLVDGDFQSDKYPTTPRGKVPLSTKDPMAQDLLKIYAARRRAVDGDFSDALETALRNHGAVDRDTVTHFVHCNAGKALFVKEAGFFIEQGGLAEPWGQAWVPVKATSIGEARRQAARIFGVQLSSIHWDEP